jgi:hypothetical protein
LATGRIAAMSVSARIEPGWSQLMHHIEVAGAADDDDACEKALMAIMRSINAVEGEATLAHRLQ